MKFATLAAAIGVAVLASACGGGGPTKPGATLSARPGNVGSRPATVQVLQVPGTAQHAPTLSTEQLDLAKSVVAADSRLSSLLAQQTSQVQEVYPWLKDDNTILGAGVVIQLGAAASLETDWPLIDRKQNPYTEYVAHFRADNVTSLIILVDLSRSRVVEFEPDKNAQAENAANITPVPVTPVP